jgi:YD repeat-containing protein
VYDSFGELTSATNGARQVTGYGYDADKDVTPITYPLPSTATWATSDTVSFGYNKQDVLNSVTDFNGHKISITNNGNSQPSSETDPTGEWRIHITWGWTTFVIWFGWFLTKVIADWGLGSDVTSALIGAAGGLSAIVIGTFLAFHITAVVGTAWYATEYAPPPCLKVGFYYPVGWLIGIAIPEIYDLVSLN